MKNNNYITGELKKISFLITTIKKTVVYAVPLHYFDTLAEEVIGKIKAGQEHTYNFGTVAPFSIAPDYFKNLSATIMQKVIQENTQYDIEVFEETQSIAPLLNTISKNPVFSIPDSYFSTLHIPFNESYKPKAKILSISRRSTIFKVAAAAIIIPFLAIKIYTLTTKEDFNFRSSNSNADIKVKSLSKEEIVNYLKKNALIENASAVSENTSNIENKIKSSMKQVTEKEIQQFLKETAILDEI